MIVLLVLAVSGAVVAVALGERDEGGSFYGFRPHLPETEDEKAAAASATAYAQAIVDKDASRACQYAAGEAFRELRCARRPRMPDSLYLYAEGRLHVEHVNLGGKTASVWVGEIDPGPGHSFELQRVGDTWRVVDDYAFGLA